MNDHDPAFLPPVSPGPAAVPSAPTIVQQMAAVGKDPTRPTAFANMTELQLVEQRNLATRRIRDALVLLNQATAAEANTMGLPELLANAAALLEGQHQARTDYTQFYAMKQEWDRIVVYLRGAYEKEIAAGRHADRDLSDVVIGYMERERANWWSQIRRWFL
jgi:hypothetical protein